MDKIITVRDQDLFPGAPVVDSSNYRLREAARAVVTDGEGKVALLHVGLHGFHKLPGGGIDPGEDIGTALERELLEEIGCKAEVTAELGETLECRDKFGLIQTSYCFMARQIGEKGEPDFTEKERRERFSIVWVKDLDSAIALLEQDEPQDYAAKFINKRDKAILKAAKSD